MQLLAVQTVAFLQSRDCGNISGGNPKALKSFRFFISTRKGSLGTGRATIRGKGKGGDLFSDTDADQGD